MDERCVVCGVWVEGVWCVGGGCGVWVKGVWCDSNYFQGYIIYQYV